MKKLDHLFVVLGHESDISFMKTEHQTVGQAMPKIREEDSENNSSDSLNSEDITENEQKK